MSLKRYITNNSSWDFPTLYIPRTYFEDESESGLIYSQTLSVKNAARNFYQGTSTYNLDTLNISLSTSGLCDPGTIIINGVDTGESTISNYQVIQDLTITFTDPTPKNYTPTTKTLFTDYDDTTVFNSYDAIEYGFTFNNPNGVSVLIDFEDELSGASYRNFVISANSVRTFEPVTYTILESDILAGELYTYVDFTESDNSGKTLSTERKTFNIPITLAEPRGELTVTITETSLSLLGTGTYSPGDTIEVEVEISNTGNLTLTNIQTEIELSGDSYSSYSDTILVPGDILTYPATYDVTNSDSGTSIVFTVSVTAVSHDPDNPDVVANSSLSMTVS